MKTFTIEITEEELKKAICDHIAHSYQFEFREKTRKIMDQMDWSKMAPHIQEALLKMAAKKLFGEV